MQSLYAKYVEEREGIELLELPNGFIKYSFGEGKNFKYCYIEDIFVDKHMRNNKYASEMADEITALAIDKGCKVLYGSVCMDMKGVSRSMKVLFGYGFEFSHKEENNMLFFIKEI